MSSTPQYSFSSALLHRRYWQLVSSVTLIVWIGISLGSLPLKDNDGEYSSYPYGLLTNFENRTLDLLFQLRDARHPHLRTRGLSEPITIIEIDEASIKASNVRLQRWPRDWYAKLVDRANEGGAAVIGVDAFFSEAGGASTEDKVGDQKLVESISAGDVVVAMKSASGGFDEINPMPMFADNAYAVGLVDVPPDSDGFVRSIPLFHLRPGQEPQFSLATHVAEGYLAATTPKSTQPPVLRMVGDRRVSLADRELPLRNDEFLQLDFRGRSPAFQRVSAADILFNKNAHIPDDAFRNRIVLIGAGNIDAPDLFPTPFYEPMIVTRMLDRSLPISPKRTPGVEVQATAVATILFGNTPVRPRYAWQIIAMLLPLCMVALALFSLRPLWGLLSVVFIAVLALAIASWAFNARSSILPLASVWLGIAIMTPSGLGIRYARERLLRSESEAEREQVMDIFSRFVSRNVANEVWERRGQASFAGETRTVTIVFTDIRNFTTLSEFEPSERVVEWLNDYFGRMNRIVESFGGHINKYIGDGLMIVFGAPVDRGDAYEARAAVNCGLTMLEEVEFMNIDWQGSGWPIIKIGCGIHTGVATCGVVGAERRLEYTVIGDAVNLSSRLESTTKEFDVPILISQSTALLMNDDYLVTALGKAQVKGKTVKTDVYTVERKKSVEMSRPDASV